MVYDTFSMPIWSRWSLFRLWDTGWNVFGPTQRTGLWDRLSSSRLEVWERAWTGTSVSWFKSRWSIPRKAESRAPLAILVKVLLVKYSSLSLGVAEVSKPAGSSLEMAFLSRCNTNRLGKTARAAGDTKRGRISVFPVTLNCIVL